MDKRNDPTGDRTEVRPRGSPKHFPVCLPADVARSLADRARKAAGKTTDPELRQVYLDAARYYEIFIGCSEREALLLATTAREGGGA